MEYGAIDLHKQESQIRLVKENGEIGDYRIATTRDRLTALFWGRPRMRILLEAQPRVSGSRSTSRASATR
jgi:hypothetical protein